MSDPYGPGSLDDGCNDPNRTIDYLTHQNTVLSDENSELADTLAQITAERDLLWRAIARMTLDIEP